MEHQETMENHVNTQTAGTILPQPASSTMSNLVFLLLSFPLGLIYFLIIVIGFSVGIGTLVVWIGLPILFITLFTIRALAEVERRVISSLLHIPMPYQLPGPPEPHVGFLRRFGRLLSDPYTWTSTIYILLKFPLGIFNFVMAVVLTTVSAALALMPLIYMINLLVNTILAANNIPSVGYIIPGFIEVHGYFDPVMFFRSFIGVPVGIVVWLISRVLLNGLALISGELARALLGPGVAYVTAQPHITGYAPPTPMETQYTYNRD
jgi:hypothetical protein